MGCLKLTYRSGTPTLKVVWNSLKDNQKGCTGAYRFGFNGMEMDNEWSGSTGTHLNFGARIYDSRINRFLSIDPSAAKYPHETPYSFVFNSPIRLNDPDGKDPRQANEPVEINNWIFFRAVNISTTFHVVRDVELEIKAREAMSSNMCVIQFISSVTGVPSAFLEVLSPSSLKLENKRLDDFRLAARSDKYVLQKALYTEESFDNSGYEEGFRQPTYIKKMTVENLGEGYEAEVTHSVTYKMNYNDDGELVGQTKISESFIQLVENASGEKYWHTTTIDYEGREGISHDDVKAEPRNE